MKIKVLSYNIHKGFTWTNRRYVIDNIKKLIDSSEADVVCLQEVVGANENIKRRGFLDNHLEILVNEFRPNYSYGKNSVRDFGHHGNMIMSRFPIMQSINIDISITRLEKRGLLISQINIPELDNKEIFISCVHLNLIHRHRLVQYQKIKHECLVHIDRPDTPFILAGDFNDWNQKSSHFFENTMSMKEAHKYIHGEYAVTFPAFRPTLKLDRIYVKNCNIVACSTLKPVSRHPLSDHLPIMCEIEIYE